MREEILSILQNIRPEADYTKSSNYIDDGLLDSFDLVALISDIEDTLGIQIPITEIKQSNFANIDTIISLIEQVKNK